MMECKCDCLLNIDGKCTRQSKEDMTALEKWKNDFKEFISELSIPRDDYKGIMEYINEVPNETRWIPVSERLPIEEFKQGRKEGWVYDLYPCLVTRTASHSRENPKRIYVAKHYFDGENFVNNGEEICNEVIAWMPLPKPYKAESEDK